MKLKATTDYWLAVALGLIVMLLAVSALLLWVIFPRGFFPSRVLWVEIHKWVGLTLAVGVLLHITLHWTWLVRMTRLHITNLRNPVHRTTEASSLQRQTGNEKGMGKEKRQYRDNRRLDGWRTRLLTDSEVNSWSGGGKGVLKYVPGYIMA